MRKRGKEYEKIEKTRTRQLCQKERTGIWKKNRDKKKGQVFYIPMTKRRQEYGKNREKREDKYLYLYEKERTGIQKNREHREDEIFIDL